MRGVFTAGVLDAFHDRRFRHFDAFYGVSAGALNLTSFISGQRGRNLQIYTGLCENTRFISLSRFLKGGHLFDLDLFFEQISRQFSLNSKNFRQALTTKPFCIVTTCAQTGLPCYLNITEHSPQPEIMAILKASCALPLIYRDSVLVDDRDLVDGSLSDPLPVIRAIEDGYRDIVLIRTRPLQQPKKETTTGRLMAWQYRHQPVLSQLIQQQCSLYNSSVDELVQLETNATITLTQIAPPGPLNSHRSSRDRARLVADYHTGYAEGYALTRRLTQTA